MLNQAKRQRLILEMIKVNGEVTTKELANEFNVTTMTISRDLNELANKDEVTLIHGGAIDNGNSLEEKPMSIKELTKISEKKYIGKYCNEIIPKGRSVFIETGTTTFAVAKEVFHKKNCTFFTNSLLVMNALSKYDEIILHTVPGKYRELSQGFIGVHTMEYVRQFNFDYCVIGAEGIGISSGVTLMDEEDALTKIAVMKQSKYKILVADSGKFKENFLYKVGSVSDFDYVITDDNVDKEIYQAIKK